MISLLYIDLTDGVLKQKNKEVYLVYNIILTFVEILSNNAMVKT